MQLDGKIAVVTGAASGIGLAIAQALAEQGARVVLCDIDAKGVQQAANQMGADFEICDVQSGDALTQMIERVAQRIGPIDIYVSNAGVLSMDPTHAASTPDALWQRAWDIHVMSHVRAARILLPDMIARGGGCLINVASAAGLLTQIGDAAYSASKAAAVSFAENLAIRHGNDGIAVHVVCPQYVASPMLGYDAAIPDDQSDDLPDGLITPRDVANALVQAMADGRVLVLPHAVVGPYFRTRATDHAKWIKGMQNLNKRAQQAQAKTASDFSKLV